jgi:Domain of unknown function (DUF3127)
MDFKGKVIIVQPVTSGVSKAGKEWSKLDFVVETVGSQYPKKCALTLWGEDKINQYDLEPGLEATFHIELESREYNGRWYTEARAWKIEWTADAKKAAAKTQTQWWETPKKEEVKEASTFDDIGDSLPF